MLASDLMEGVRRPAGRKAVAMVSGGIDSSTLLYQLASEGYDVHALTFIYGQKHSKEVEAARNITSRLRISHRVVDLSSLQNLLTSALTSPNMAVPEVPTDAGHYDTLKLTIVPNRNSIFLAIAIGFATSIGANYVFYGAHHSDRGVYPDCRREFIQTFEQAERLATDNPTLKVEAPFISMMKAQIVELGSKLGVPYEVTWSCYKGGEKHCGVCSSCRERRRAFHEARVPDPTVYER